MKTSTISANISASQTTSASRAQTAPKRLDAVTQRPQSATKPEGQSFSQVLNDFATNWDKAQRESQAKINKLPSDYRSLLELQLTVHRLNLSAELVSRAGEAASGTVKKLQQMGSN